MAIALCAARAPRITLGVVANEFFEPRAGRMGGFGWAARQVARLFSSEPGLGVDVVLLNGEVRAPAGAADPVVHGARMILRRGDEAEYRRRVCGEGFHLLLSIDYRPEYDLPLGVLPRTPLIVWSRDPRTPGDVARVETARIPGAEDRLPSGLRSPACRSLAGIVEGSARDRRPVLFAAPDPFLVPKMPETYGVRPAVVSILPNIIDLDPGEARKADRPRAVFLGRLDPIKRPWLFVELARRFTDVDFVFLGQAHFHGPGAWAPASLPGNVRMLGHVEGSEKIRILSGAWVLVNTSIHEALAVSFQEALMCETPLLGLVDPGGVVSRFGIHAGRWDGTGLEGIPPLAEGMARMLGDASLRRRLGREGRAWVAGTHSRRNFLDAFDGLCARAGVPRPAGRRP